MKTYTKFICKLLRCMYVQLWPQKFFVHKKIIIKDFYLQSLSPLKIATHSPSKLRDLIFFGVSFSYFIAINERQQRIWLQWNENKWVEDAWMKFWAHFFPIGNKNFWNFQPELEVDLDFLSILYGEVDSESTRLHTKFHRLRALLHTNFIMMSLYNFETVSIIIV
jgi:hypothetical protein